MATNIGRWTYTVPRIEMYPVSTECAKIIFSFNLNLMITTYIFYSEYILNWLVYVYVCYYVLVLFNIFLFLFLFRFCLMCYRIYYVMFLVRVFFIFAMLFPLNVLVRLVACFAYPDSFEVVLVAVAWLLQIVWDLASCANAFGVAFVAIVVSWRFEASLCPERWLP